MTQQGHLRVSDLGEFIPAPFGPYSPVDDTLHLTLADMTTLHVGGEIARHVVAQTREEFIDVIRAADRGNMPLLILGGGSNILAGDDPFNGLVLRDGRAQVQVVEKATSRGVETRSYHDNGFDEKGAVNTVKKSYEGAVRLKVSAGTPWDEFVCWTLAHGLSGAEALSGIPGTVGAAPVQNIGAYGHEVASILDRVHVWDRERNKERVFTRSELELGYRTSLIKRSRSITRTDGQAWGGTSRFVVIDVIFQLESSPLSAPIFYAELARQLGVHTQERTDAATVREAVLELRRGKGMVLDPMDKDTWSAGSFFVNPILKADKIAHLPADAPRFAVGEGNLKTSAAWLISHAGFERGYVLVDPVSGRRPVSLSTRHVLALTNRGGARAADFVALAHEIQARVRAAFDVDLIPEPVTLGVCI